VTLLAPANCAFMRLPPDARAALLDTDGAGDNAAGGLTPMQATLLLHTLPGSWSSAVRALADVHNSSPPLRALNMPRSQALATFLARWPTLLEQHLEQTCERLGCDDEAPPPAFVSAYALPGAAPTTIPTVCERPHGEDPSAQQLAAAAAAMGNRTFCSQLRVTHGRSAAAVLRADVPACRSTVHVTDRVFAPSSIPADGIAGMSAGGGVSVLALGLSQVTAPEGDEDGMPRAPLLEGAAGLQLTLRAVDAQSGSTCAGEQPATMLMVRAARWCVDATTNA